VRKADPIMQTVEAFRNVLFGTVLLIKSPATQQRDFHGFEISGAD
jgi:hypothetical protein